MSKPLLLLDVDGVLCPFRGFDLFCLGYEKYEGFTWHPRHMVHTSEANAARVQRLMESFDIHWCTGWEHSANDVISPLHNVPRFPVVEIKAYSRHIHWKFDAIEAYVGDRPYAFVDDDIEDDGLAYADARATPTMWLPTSCSEGLTDEHVEKLEEFARHCVEYANAQEI